VSATVAIAGGKQNDMHLVIAVAELEVLVEDSPMWCASELSVWQGLENQYFQALGQAGAKRRAELRSSPGEAIARLRTEKTRCDDRTNLLNELERVVKDPKVSLEELSLAQSAYRQAGGQDLPDELAEAVASVTARLQSPAPQVPEPAIQFEITTPGHDAEHGAKVRAALEKAFRPGESLSRRFRGCLPLVEKISAVVVRYDSGTRLTSTLVATSRPLPPLDTYPGGRRVDSACSAVAAVAFWLAWPTSEVNVLHQHEAGAVALTWGRSGLGRSPGPPAVNLVVGDDYVRVQNYGKGSSILLFEYPGVDPDGSPNPSQLLENIIGSR